MGGSRKFCVLKSLFYFLHRGQCRPGLPFKAIGPKGPTSTLGFQLQYLKETYNSASVSGRFVRFYAEKSRQDVQK